MPEGKGSVEIEFNEEKWSLSGEWENGKLEGDASSAKELIISFSYIQSLFINSLFGEYS